MRRAAEGLPVALLVALLTAAGLPRAPAAAAAPAAGTTFNAATRPPASKTAAAPAPAEPPARAVDITVRLLALADTVIAHQTAWIEVRISNSGTGPVTVPCRADKIVGEWRFTDDRGQVVLNWPREEDLKGASRLTIGPNETLYEVLSPEMAFGVLTGPGTVQASCRAGGSVSPAARLTRRLARDSDPPSALRTAGQLQGRAREKARVQLWSLCARDGGYFDCDEALFTVAWDRMLVSPTDAAAVVDTLIARSPDSGWCRAALMELITRLPEAAGQRYLESVLARRPGGVAEAFAGELLRRATHGECPAAGKKK